MGCGGSSAYVIPYHADFAQPPAKPSCLPKTPKTLTPRLPARSLTAAASSRCLESRHSTIYIEALCSHQWAWSEGDSASGKSDDNDDCASISTSGSLYAWGASSIPESSSLPAQSPL
eukprot:EG_transcript_29198